jgi:high-affinity nickel-transport protein
LLSACRAPVGPAGTLDGTWSGAIVDSDAGSGTATLTMTQRGQGLSGTWSATFGGGAVATGGSLGGSTVGATASLFLTPAAPRLFVVEHAERHALVTATPVIVCRNLYRVDLHRWHKWDDRSDAIAPSPLLSASGSDRVGAHRMSRVSAVGSRNSGRSPGVIVLLHVVGWGMAVIAARSAVSHGSRRAGIPFVSGTPSMWIIAAIDNTTRKLMAPSRRPFGVGFFFALGHSTVVLLMTLAIALAARTVAAELPALRTLGSYVGTTISGVFLYVMGIVNLIVLIDVYRVFVAMHRGPYDAQTLEATLRSEVGEPLVQRPFRSCRVPADMLVDFSLASLRHGDGSCAADDGRRRRVTRPAARRCAESADCFCGGDVSDGQRRRHHDVQHAGGRSRTPLRKVFYNLTITGLSVVVALFVGTIQLVPIVTDRVDIHTGIWGVIQDLDFQTVGYLVAGLFASWLASLAVWRFGRLGRELGTQNSEL